ncbi:RICIN domain-containing protein [Pseudoxanthomonas indica]|uniref:Ricin B lectin domain-containing protein n=1 Tax=Pseudoxanthomonas indica TaxID=428993 RepID=A0A1T5KDF3_9GAMM|nr:RICIN domain-containing protein [Pseudoxanthomonas indica]GGD48660.1 hypothetical protein GCM10007235_20710 [Pseudoxanthomonas indica]SKC61752.1 hypothetical protein SAMN06296058_1610 [Pseudoxanthomonas indica]
MKFDFPKGWAALLGAGLLASASAGAQSEWIDYGIINKADSHKCISLQADAQHAEGAAVSLQACATDVVDGSQAWGWIPAERKLRKGAKAYAFQNVLSKTCMGVQNASTRNKALLVSVRCDFNDPAQLWVVGAQLRAGSSLAGSTKWVNLKSRKCIDLDDDGRLMQLTCQWSAPYWPQEYIAP